MHSTKWRVWLDNLMITILTSYHIHLFYIHLSALIKGVIPGISEDRGSRFLKYEDRRYNTLKYEEVKTQEYRTN